MPWSDTITRLRAKGLSFESGLTSGEIASAEECFGFHFPDDYREFLSEALPTGERFPDWRNRSESIRDSLAWPWEGMAFDIEQNSWWHNAWGDKPTALEEALRVAKEHFDKAPRLIPVYGHRYISSDPSEAGNPIYSVYQMDIIFYGATLAEYFEIEFLGSDHSMMSESIRSIRFWSDVVE